MLLLLKVKFFLEDVLGLTKEEGWNVPRSLAEATDGSSLTGVAFSSTSGVSTLALDGDICVAVSDLSFSMFELSSSVILLRSSFLDF